MSEIKLVSPLLDGFAIGDPISDHNGIRCCPAMRENSDDKYIVKIISIPSSQKQLDALLLTKAYKDADAAAAYFKELAEDTVKEARLLQQLAKLEGFLSYEDWQIVPMEGDETGYDVYLLGSYRRSLESNLRRNAMTHLGAVNLGIDICTALSLCRRAGFIYTDLKPGNIYLSGQQEYRIGDLGFARLSSMKYTSMPANYISRFTPPELHDPIATLNPTVDTYALGMILYMIYNNGHIPFETKAPMMILPSPLNADYEMAEIIQKACDPNPRKRYQTPVEMGKALVSYMQRNRINDFPISPVFVEYAPVQKVSTQKASAPAAAVTAPPAEMAFTPTEEPADEMQFLDNAVPKDTAPEADLSDASMTVPEIDEVDQIPVQTEDLIPNDPEIDVDMDDISDLLAEDEDILVEEDVPEEAFEVPDVSAEIVEDPTDDTADSLFPADETTEPTDNILTDESAFDAFFSSLPQDEEDYDDFDGFDMDNDGIEEDVANIGNMSKPVLPSEAEIPEISDTNGDFFTEAAPRKKHKWILPVILLLILGLLAGGALYFYNNIYLLTVDNMVIEGSGDRLSISLTTDADESLLRIVCTDTYGNKQEKEIMDGGAVFTNLNPDTMYKVTVVADGFHKLTGSVSGSYTTAQEIRIVDFTAKNGIADGSVVLNFTADGPEIETWIIEYSAEGEPLQSLSFTGHMVTINDLAVGKLYTMTLVPDTSAELFLNGKTSIEYLASKVIVAEKLNIVSCVDGLLTAAWEIPEGAAVENWTVRCYSEGGYDETVTVTEPTVQFKNIDSASAYTVEVTAADMSQSARAFVTANPSTVTDVQITHAAETGMSITWNSSNTPDGGWLVMYSLDDSETTEMAECTGNTASVKNIIPNAAYNFRIMAADGSTVFGGNAQYPGIEATAFNRFGLSADKIQSSLCHTPANEDWTYEDVDNDSYTTSYAQGESASLVLYTNARFYLKTDEIAVMFIIRDAEGKVIPTLVRTKISPWRDLWSDDAKYCYLDLPVMPADLGDYTLEVYFDGAIALTKNFSIISTNG